MGNQAFAVYEKDDRNQYLCEYFGSDRNSAITYLKKRIAIIDQELKNWNKELGINYCIWKNDKHFREIKLKIIEVSSQDKNTSK